MQAEAELNRTHALSRFWTRRPRWNRILAVGGLVLAVLFFVTSLAAYLTDMAVHPIRVVDWYDLNVYNDAGLITRQLPSILYSWELHAGIKYTYTPFAAIIFAGGSFLSWISLRWLMTVASLISLPLTVWLTLGAMGRRGWSRLAVALAVSAVGLWVEPMTKALYLGQIEPLLLLLVVWDLTRSDQRKWKGVGIGLAAGIKLVPLLFIPYLLLSGKVRQAAVAAGTFAATIVLGFMVLPGPSATYWPTGYFIRPGRTGAVDSLVNQSLLGLISRLAGGNAEGRPIWLPVVIVVGLMAVVGGAVLTRLGKPVQGWVLVGIATVLASPISWDHHWVWIVPALAMLGGLAMTSVRRLARWGWVVAMLLTASLFGAWPWYYTGSRAWVPERGFLGWFVKPPAIYQVTTLHGWQLVTWNLYVLAGCLYFVAMLVVAWLLWRKRPPRSVTPPATPSAIDALLARADAVLKGGTPLIGTKSGQP